MSENKANEAVAKGIAKLDANKSDWRDVIDVKTLVMSSGDNCVLGQIFDTYDEGLDKLGISTYTGRELGFDEEYSDYTYQELKDAWTKVLTLKTGDLYKALYSSDRVKIVKTVRLDDKNYVIWQYTSGGTPSISKVSTFLASYRPVPKEKAGTILRGSTTGKLFMAAIEGGDNVWDLSKSYGSVGHITRAGAERDHGKLVVVQTHMGRDVVGGMHLSI